jgi:hypothetical protein
VSVVDTGLGPNVGFAEIDTVGAPPPGGGGGGVAGLTVTSVQELQLSLSFDSVTGPKVVALLLSAHARTDLTPDVVKVYEGELTDRLAPFERAGV